MRSIALFALSSLLASPQDSSRITLEQTAPFRALAEELSKKSGEKVLIDSGVEDKTLELRVRDAGFYQALDALCRAHGGVTYVKDEIGSLEGRGFAVRQGAWIEHPASYSGPYRVALHSLTRIKSTSEKGAHAWVRANLEVFWPPSLSVTRTSGSRLWECTAAVDREGRDVRPTDGAEEPDELVSVHTGAGYGNSLSHSIRLADFDIAGGLQRFEGKAVVEVARGVDVRVPLKAGTKVETPQGAVLVQSVNELRKGDDGSSWLISLKYEPRKPGKGRGREVFEHDARLDQKVDVFLSYSWEEDGQIEIKTWNETPRPKVLVLRARDEPMTIDIPFSFKNASFKAK